MNAVVRRIPYKNKLGAMIHAPGGKRIGEALADAQANVAALSEEGFAEMDRLVAAIQAATREGFTPEARLVVYDRANEIVSVAGVFGLDDLGKAAYSLCELLDRSDENPRYNEALKVHVDSLMLLRKGAGLSDAERSAVLDGLVRVVGRISTAAEL